MDLRQNPGPTRQTRLIVIAIVATTVIAIGALVAYLVDHLTHIWWSGLIVDAIIVVGFYMFTLRSRTPHPTAQVVEVSPAQATAVVKTNNDDTQELPLNPVSLVGTQVYDHNPHPKPYEVFTGNDGAVRYVVRQTAATTESWIPGKRAKSWHVTTRSVTLDKSPLVSPHLILRSGLTLTKRETRIHYLQRFDWWRWGKRPVSLLIGASMISVILGIEVGGPLSIYLGANCLVWLVALGFCFAAWIKWGHIVLVLTDQRFLLLHNPPFPFIQDQTTGKLLRLVSTFDKRSSRFAKTFFNDRYGTIKAGTQEQDEEDAWMHTLPYVRHYAELQLMVTEIMNDAGATPEGRLLKSIRDSLGQERPHPQP